MHNYSREKLIWPTKRTFIIYLYELTIWSACFQRNFSSKNDLFDVDNYDEEWTVVLISGWFCIL